VSETARNNDRIVAIKAIFAVPDKVSGLAQDVLKSVAAVAIAPTAREHEDSEAHAPLLGRE
jgi:hypothetical protein